MKPSYGALGRKIYDLRLEIGMATQGELAQQLGTSQQTISRWEAGSSRPRPNELSRLAAALKVNITELINVAGYAPEVATVSFDRPLPLSSLLPDSFEYFCLDLLATHHHGKADLHPAGKTGHKQYGIDIEAQFTNGNVHTYQCKREAKFGPEKVRKAIEAQSIAAQKKYILLSRVASPDARSEIKRVPGWDIWDQTDITRLFRTLPKREQVRIVDIYFPTQRFALTGELAAGPWQTAETFFAPQLIEGRPFNQLWELVGRRTELDQLAHALADPDVLAVSLIGRAGDGKSRVLRSALEAFASRHKHIRVVVASTTDEVTTKSLDELGAGEKLLVVDDVHDRNDLIPLIRYVADTHSQARLLLLYRSYWSDVVQRELARYGLTGKLTSSITLAKPTKQDGVTLASQVLVKSGAPTDFAERIAAVAYDSPLAIVVGAQIVANEGVHPELFGSNETFRTTVLKHYEKVIAQGIAQGKDQDRVHKILLVLALIQPITPDDKHVLELLESIEGIKASDASRLVHLLIDAGVLFKRGTKFRLSPDLLADSIIESACITQSDASNGYAEKVFAASIPEHKEHVLLNLGRLDWRRNEGNTSTSTLLDGLWSQIGWEDDYVHAQVKAAAAAAYFQPRQALALARRLINNGHGQEEYVSRIIQGATYHIDYLTEACTLLWEAGQHDARSLNQHPNHAIRILTELATPEPRKPIEVVECVVDFALSLLDYSESWEGKYTPLDVLNGALATGGHFTSAATSREFTISRYTVQRDRVKQVRQRIISALLSNLSHANQRYAFLVAQHLSNALRGPMAAQLDVADSWLNEFVDTLEKIDGLLSTTDVPPTILLRIAESIQWHAFYGFEHTRGPAQRILARLDRDLATRTIRAIMDAWGSNTWSMEEGNSRSQYDEDTASLCLDLGAQYPEPANLAQFLHSRLEDIGRATGTPDYQPAHSFFDRLLQTNLPLARHLVQRYLHEEESLLSSHIGRALGVLLSSARSEASALIDDMLAKDDSHLPIIAEGYLLATTLATYSELDRLALKRVFCSREGRVLWCVSRIAQQISRYDKRLAIELLTSVDIASALHYTSDFFVWIVQEQTIPFNMIRDDQLQRLIDGLRPVSHLDNHWVNAFLKKAIQRVPESIIKLAMERINDAIDSEDWEKQPISGPLHDQNALDLMSLTEGPALLLGLLDWALSRNGNTSFSYRFAELVQSLCSPYDAACVAAFDEWLTGGTAEHFKIISLILRDAGFQFVHANEQFIARTLKAARGVSRLIHSDLSSAIFSASVSGLRTGIPGQPFSVDLELKAMAEQRMANLAKTDPAFELYRDLRNHATQEIERQIAAGRSMDEADSDA